MKNIVRIGIREFSNWYYSWKDVEVSWLCFGLLKEGFFGRRLVLFRIVFDSGFRCKDE